MDAVGGVPLAPSRGLTDKLDQFRIYFIYFIYVFLLSFKCLLCGLGFIIVKGGGVVAVWVAQVALPCDQSLRSHLV